MAKPNIQILFDGSEATMFFEKMRTKFQSIKAGMNEVGKVVAPIVFADIIDHFKNQEGPNGAWPAWSPAYAIVAKKKGQTNILQDTGKLRNSLIPAAGKFKSSSGGFLFYTTVEYGARHDQGTGGMPKRQFMYIGNKGLDKTAEILLKWISE